MKILVTGANGDIAEGIFKILKKSISNISIDGCDINGDIPGKYNFNKILKIPKASDQSYLLKILKLSKYYDLVIPTNENEIYKISKHFKNKDDHKFLVNKFNIVNTFSNKKKASEFFYNYNFKTPQTFFNTKLIKKKIKQVYCKPIIGSGSKGHFLLENNKSLDNLNLKNYFYQEYIEYNKEYTCVLYRYNNILRTIIMERKLKGGISYYVKIINSAKINKILKELSSIINLKGSINLQLCEFKKQIYIFEINPRLSSTVYVRHLLNFKDCLWWIKDKMKIKYKIDPNSSKNRTAFRKYNEFYLD